MDSENRVQNKPTPPAAPGSIQVDLTGIEPLALFGERDATLARLSPDGSRLFYGTYLGGSTVDQARGVAVDPLGDVVITGSTSSDDFPTTPGAYDTTYNGGGDIFVTKLRLGLVPPDWRKTFLPLLRL